MATPSVVEVQAKNWGQCLNDNTPALISTLNLTDLLLLKLKSVGLFTNEEYESIKKHEAVNTTLRSIEFVSVLGNGPDRFSKPEKLKVLIEAFKHKDSPRPALAEIFQKYLDDNFGGYEVDAPGGTGHAAAAAPMAPVHFGDNARIAILGLGPGSGTTVGGNFYVNSGDRTYHNGQPIDKK